MLEASGERRTVDGVAREWKGLAHLDSGLVEFGDAGEFFATVNVGVVALGEGSFQLLQLLLGEGGPVSSPGRSGWTRGRGAARGAISTGRPVVWTGRGERGQGTRVQVVQARLHFKFLEGRGTRNH